MVLITPETDKRYFLLNRVERLKYLSEELEKKMFVTPTDFDFIQARLAEIEKITKVALDCIEE